MTTALEKLPEENNQLVPADVSAGALQSALAGDLAKLPEPERLKFYGALCNFTGLNPLAKPFDWLTFQGKLTLYANKGCAEQLRSLRKVSVEIIDRKVEFGCLVVRVRGQMPDGRHDEALAAVPFQESFNADVKALAMMKCETKAKRRLTFSICGLSMLLERDDDLDKQGKLHPDILTGALEDSAASRAERLNRTLTEGEKDKAIDISESRTETVAPLPAASAASSPTTPASERSGSQPVSSPNVSVVPPPVENSAQFSPSAEPDFTDDSPPRRGSAELSEAETRGRNVEMVFSEQELTLSKNAIELLNIMGDLPRGKGWEDLKLETAQEILKDPVAFFKWVQQVIGWLVFKGQLKENEPLKNVAPKAVSWIAANPERLKQTVKQWVETNKR